MKKDEARNIESKIENKDLVKSTNLFPVVGIGASSGGLEAFKKFIKAIPENSGMAYVFVQHLHPEYESVLTEILQKVTKIPVIEITDEIKVQPNHIYIIPSNKMLIANDGVLELSPRPEKSLKKLNLPIDLFFASLGEIHQSYAIGIVLSGTGSDGTVGLQKIKEQGGIAFAQSTASAAYDGMPNSAIQAGVVDYILPPEDMPAKLQEVVLNINLTEAEVKSLSQQDDQVFKQILSLLRTRKGTDFTFYKQTTIRRRILRRMGINKNATPAEYLTHLQENKKEQDALYQDLLIPVTSFFRDDKIFNTLCQSVFPQIIKNQSTAVPIRIWVAGCSTGQEAYSMAICLKEFLGNNKDRVQIFATDISEPAIAKSRTGIYTKAELEEVSSQRLQDFFTKTTHGFRVNKEIRDMCVFAIHNFLKDPPFNKMDFISCRNVLIYMEPYLQKKALTTFHYALNSNCFLLLGKSETSSAVPTLFSAAEKHDKLFIRKEATTKFLYTGTNRNEQQLNNLTTNTITESMQTDFQKTADELMLRKYTPAGVVVNEAMDIVHFRGNTSIFLEQAPGKPSHNLLKMAKNGLAFELRNIIYKAKKENNAVVKDNIPIHVNGKHLIVTIEATPLPNVVEPHYLILFHDNENSQISRQQIANTQPASKLKKDEKDLYIQQIEKELAQTREDMRSITEDQEAANEELQSANEELLSGSEELQSLNEELETSKEELQSSNEELTVVNHELVSLNEQVTAAQQFAESIVDTLREPLLVLDKKLRVKTANKAFYKMFEVTEKETEGNLLYDLGNNQWDNAALRTMLEDILPQKETFTDFEVFHNFPKIGKRKLLLNARELKGMSGPEKLILLVMEDVTEQEKYRLKENEFLGRFKNILLQVSAGVAVFKGLQFYVEMANESFLKIVGKYENDFVGKPFFESMPESKIDLEPILTGVFKTGIPYYSNETEYSTIISGKIQTGYCNFVYQPVYEEDGSVSGIICVANDITEIILARKKVEQSEHRYHNMIYTSPSLIAIFKGEEMIIEIANDAIIESWDKGKNVLGRSLYELMPETTEQGFDKLLNSVYKTGKPVECYELPVIYDRNGKAETVYYSFIYQAQKNINGEIEGVAVIANEVTPQAIINKKIKESEEHFRMLVLQAPIAISVTRGEDYVIEIINEKMAEIVGRTVEELIDKPVFEALTEIEGQGFKELLDNVYKTGERFVAEELPMSINRNGILEDIYLKFIYEPMLDADGKVNGIMTVSHEITEQVLGRKKIEESEEKFRLLTNTMAQKIATTDAEGNVLFFNQQWIHDSGYSFEELKNWGFEKSVHPDDIEFVKTNWQKSITTGNIFDMEFRMQSKDGIYKWYLSRGLPIKDEQGKIMMWVASNTDIQNQKEQKSILEKAVFERTKELEEANKELAFQNAEKENRSQELGVMNKELVYQNEEKEKRAVELGIANKELTAFNYISSHDLQEPLRKIQTFASLILEEEYQGLSRNAKDYFLRMQDSANRMQKLIIDLLAYSRTNTTERQFEQLSLNEIIVEAIYELADTIDITKTTINKDVAIALNMNKFQLKQLIINLISNAIKFSKNDIVSVINISAKIEKGEIFQEEISNGTIKLNPNTEYGRLRFSDNGIGFDAQYKDKIFELFQRLHGNASYAGTGIGLAIVKKIVENHYGFITADSTLNEGATFTIYIPKDIN